jgi:plasmid stability protein
MALRPDAGTVDMWITCVYIFRMSIMIQIRNVPEALHRTLKSRAALAGMSLSDYLLDEIRQVAERPTADELRARLRSRTEAALSASPAEAVRAERDLM